MEKAALDLNALLKAQALFERFANNIKDDQDKAGAVLAFKMCYELALRSMKQFLQLKGVETSSPKDIFRKSGVAQLTDTPDVWFDFLEKRNLTALAYEQENMDAIITVFDLFSSEVDKVIRNMNA